MVDVRNIVEQAVEALARATEPIAHAASGTAESGANAAAQGLQVTQAVASTLIGALRALPGQLRELELPSARQRLEDIADQLQKIAQRLGRLSHHLGRAAGHLGEPALQGSGKLIVNGIDVAASGLGLLRPNEAGLFRLLPRSVARPYADGVATLHVGVSAAGDLARLLVNSLPGMSEGLGDIAEDLGRAGELLEATAHTLRELSELSPI
jgi:hypothetical protein